MDERYSEVFCKIIALHEAEKRPPLNGTIAIYDIGGNWFIAVNGAENEQAFQRNARDGVPLPEASIPPFSALVYWGDWPAGIIDPYGGCLAAGESANEDTLCAALDAAIASVAEVKDG